MHEATNIDLLRMTDALIDDYFDGKQDEVVDRLVRLPPGAIAYVTARLTKEVLGNPSELSDGFPFSALLHRIRKVGG